MLMSRPLTTGFWCAIHALMVPLLACSESDQASPHVAPDGRVPALDAASGGAGGNSGAGGIPTASGGAAGGDSGSGGTAGDAMAGGGRPAGCRAGLSIGCGTPTECGPVVQPHEVLTTAPAALGGTIQDGLYFLTAANFYRKQAAAAPPTYQITRSFQRGFLAAATYVGSSAQSPLSGPYATAGNTLTWSVSCTISSVVKFNYTATGQTLILYEQIGTGPQTTVAELIHQKQ